MFDFRSRWRLQICQLNPNLKPRSHARTDTQTHTHTSSYEHKHIATWAMAQVRYGITISHCVCVCVCWPEWVTPIWRLLHINCVCVSAQFSATMRPLSHSNVHNFISVCVCVCVTHPPWVSLNETRLVQCQSKPWAQLNSTKMKQTKVNQRIDRVSEILESLRECR